MTAQHGTLCCHNPSPEEVRFHSPGFCGAKQPSKWIPKHLYLQTQSHLTLSGMAAEQVAPRVRVAASTAARQQVRQARFAQSFGGRVWLRVQVPTV